MARERNNPFRQIEEKTGGGGKIAARREGLRLHSKWKKSGKWNRGGEPIGGHKKSKPEEGNKKSEAFRKRRLRKVRIGEKGGGGGNTFFCGSAERKTESTLRGEGGWGKKKI